MVLTQYRVQHNRFLTFQSATGSQTDQIVLPLSCLYLHTCYFRLHSGFELTQEDKKFASMTWEVINILKENFPSKVFISQENLEQCRPHYNPMSSQEENRRQISCLMSMKDEGRYLTFDEVEDAWHTLQTAEKLNDQRAINVCLDLIATQTLNWVQAKQVIEVDVLQRVVNKSDYTQLTANKVLAQDILDRLNNPSAFSSNEANRGLDNLGMGDETLSLAGSETLGNLTNTGGTNQEMMKTTNEANFEKPTSTRMCLFQLSESNDINRVTMILETLGNRSKETLQQMRKRYNLNSKLVGILKKYCNAEYGFDQLSSRQGTFQSNLLKLLVVLTSDYVVFLECLQSQTFEFLSQLIEEAIIFSYEDAISGAASAYSTNAQGNKCNYQSGLNQDLFKFLNLSLDFIELSISKQFQEFLPQIGTFLRKIQARMVKLIQKKDSPLLSLFIQNYTTQATNQPHQDHSNPMMIVENDVAEEHLDVEQLGELKGLSEQLYMFAMDLGNKVQKIEALVDMQEEYEEKHQRLFFRVAPGLKYLSKGVVQGVDYGRTEAQDKPTKVQFEADQKKEARQHDAYDYAHQKDTRKVQEQSRKHPYEDRNKENRPYLPNQVTLLGGGTFDNRESSAFTSNVFKKNQAEVPQQTYKRTAQQHQNDHQSEQVTRDQRRGEHYIGSPIKPYQKEQHQYYATNYDSLQERDVPTEWRNQNKYL